MAKCALKKCDRPASAVPTMVRCEVDMSILFTTFLCAEHIEELGRNKWKLISAVINDEISEVDPKILDF